MSQAKRIAELEKKAGTAEDTVTVTIDDRQEHIDFWRWFLHVQGKDDIGPVEISPEEERKFRPPFTVTYTKAEWEDMERADAEWVKWMRDSLKGGPVNEP